jgi:predicted PurR-regulated permease PerM
MALPILQIARLLGQLTTIGPVVTEGVDKIRKLVESIRKGEGNSAGQLDALKQAIELQSAVNRKVEDQLQIVESVLKNVQRSLKIMAISTTTLGVVAIAALVAAILK